MIVKKVLEKSKIPKYWMKVEKELASRLFSFVLLLIVSCVKSKILSQE